MTPPLIEAADVSLATDFASSWANISHNAYVLGDLVIFHLASDTAGVTHTLPSTGPNGETITVHINDHAPGGGGPNISVWSFIGSATTAAGTVTVTPSAAEAMASASVVVKAGEFNVTTPIEAFNTGGNSANSTSAPSPVLSGTNPDGTVLVFISVDSKTITASPSGWTDLGTADQGQVLGLISVRDAATTTSETIASASWTIATTGDTSSTSGLVVNAPAGGPTGISIFRRRIEG